MRKVTVAQALKERKRLETRLLQYRSLIREQNCILEGSKRLIDVLELMRKCDELEGQLLKVRVAIAQANAKISARLIELALLKDRQKFVSTIPCDESSIERYGNENFLRKEAVINAQSVLEMNESLTDRINAIQDTLDQFNACEAVVIQD